MKPFIVLGLCSAFLYACSDDSDPPPIQEHNFEVSGGYQLKRFTSQDELESYVRQSFKETHYQPVIEPAFDLQVTEAADAPTATSGSLSQTNVQVNGVDEADRIKHDGSLLYVARSHQGYHAPFIAFRAPVAESLTVSPSETSAQKPAAGVDIYALNNAGETPIAQWQSDTYFKHLYLDQAHQQLILIPDDDGQPGWFDYFAWNSTSTTLQALNIANPLEPAPSWSLHFEGAIVSSRMLNGKLYVVTRFSPSLADDSDKPQLPHWSNPQKKELYAKSEQCFYPDQAPQNVRSDLIGIHVVHLSESDPEVESLCYVGNTETLFMSQENLYLATTHTHYNLLQDDTGSVIQYQPDTRTDLHRFALGTGKPQYIGSARVAGHLGWKQDQKPFRMGEHNGVLGIVTSTGAFWNAAEEEDVSHFYTLGVGENGFGIINQLPNSSRPQKIGKPGEQVYGVRFVGNRAYAVTFKTIDPLYVIDWSDAADPFIAGELEIPGFSEVLQPLGENLILGIGQAVTEVQGWGDQQFAVAAGIKLSLFDVSNPQAPTEIEALTLGKRGSQAGVARDHHALAQLYRTNTDDYLMALPLSIYADNYRWTHTGQYRFKIDTSGITQLDTVIADSTEYEYDYPDYDVANDRSLISNDESWYLHGNRLIHTQH